MRRFTIPILIFIAALALTAVAPARAQTTQARSAFAAGNYCVSCHLADDPRLASVTDWKGGIAREADNPCPAASNVREQLYYTERLMLMIDRAEAQSPALSEKSHAQFEGYEQQYSRQLDEPVTSLDAFTAQSQTTRFRLNKIYASLNASIEAAKRVTVLRIALGVTLFILLSLVWGLYNTRAARASNPKRASRFIRAALFVLIVIGFFALPLFRVPAAQIVMPTIAEQRTQTILDTADRAASSADRAQARAWALARLGAAWNESNPYQSLFLFDESLLAVTEARKNNDALWGQSLHAQEAAVGNLFNMQKADLIANDLNASRDRAWSVPLIAVEINKVDSAHAVEVLQSEQDLLRGQVGIYKDFQLRAVALAWTKINPTKAVPTAEGIYDPSIRAWTLREIAALTQNASAYRRAAEAARKIEDPVQRARALREIGNASGNKSLFAEALDALKDAEGSSLAYALAELAVAARDEALVEQIESSFPDARAYAYYRLGNYQAAWDETAEIADPYEQARAQAAIAGTWVNADAAGRIRVPLYRDLALRDIVRANKDKSLAYSIQSPYYEIQALTALGLYDEALELADGLGDTYPLVELAKALAAADLQSALTLVEKMTRESDKAVALREIAKATNDPDLFKRALGMALAARVRGDSLAPVSASLDLAEALWAVNAPNAQSALRQAYETAKKISVK